MKILVSILTATAFFTFTCYSANAQELPLYIGAGGGQTNMGSGVSNVTGTGELDEGATDGKFYAGLNVFENFSVEFEYFKVSQDSFKLRVNAGDTFKFDNSTYIVLNNGTQFYADGEILALSGRYNHKIGEKSTLFARLGFSSWDIDLNGWAPSVGTETDNRTGNDLMLGVGASYDINEHFFVGLQYEHIYLGDGLEYISYSTADIGYRF